MAVDVIAYSEEDDVLLELVGLANDLAGHTGGKSFAMLMAGGVADPGEFGSFVTGGIYVVKGVPATQSLQEAAPYMLSEVARRHESAIVLLGSTRNEKVTAGRLAAKLDATVATECSSVAYEEGRLNVKRLSFSGRAETSITLSGRYVIVCMKPRSHQKAERSTERAQVTQLEVPVPETPVRVVEVKDKPASSIDLTKAEKIVSVGRGLKKKEDLSIIQDLAEALGASVGCSRPLSADLEWLPEEAHIGLTGVQVKPKLYLAVGISGQLQHLAGVKDAGTIVAINLDKSAPIFGSCDYGIVGDLYQVVPEVVRQLRALRLERR
jgi:electron transfer flavoprotein alpha subunit